MIKNNTIGLYKQILVAHKSIINPLNVYFNNVNNVYGIFMWVSPGGRLEGWMPVHVPTSNQTEEVYRRRDVKNHRPQHGKKLRAN